MKRKEHKMNKLSWYPKRRRNTKNMLGNIAVIDF